jgi:hypothetical protein
MPGPLTSTAKKDLAMNIFQVATTAPAKVPKRAGKQTVHVPELASAIEAFNTAKEEIDALEANLAEAQHAIHVAGRKAFLDLYRSGHHNPDSFILEADNGLRVMYLPTDKYKTIDQARSHYLREKYGEAVTTEATEYAFDAELLERYAEAISTAILNVAEIPEEDKPRLIIAKTKYSVTKGSIDRLLDAPDPNEMLEEIQPVIQLKRA